MVLHNAHPVMRSSFGGSRLRWWDAIQASIYVSGGRWQRLPSAVPLAGGRFLLAFDRARYYLLRRGSRTPLPLVLLIARCPQIPGKGDRHNGSRMVLLLRGQGTGAYLRGATSGDA